MKFAYISTGVNTSSPLDSYTGLGGSCFVGHYCPEGSAAPLPCEPGTYRSVTSSQSSLVLIVYIYGLKHVLDQSNYH